MSNTIDFSTYKTKRDVEAEKIECLSPGSLDMYKYLASLAKKYKSPIINNKSDNALILKLKELLPPLSFD